MPGQPEPTGEGAPPPEAPEPPAPEVGPDAFEHGLRLAEALIFASDKPVTVQRLQGVLPEGLQAQAVLTALVARTADRPVQCVEVAGGFAFRTAPELAPALTRVVEVPRRLPRVAMETLAIIAYHQPVTRAEIEEIRGASLAQTTLEALLELGLVAPRGRKEVPGRPSLWVTTPRFLEQFGLKALGDLPRREELVNEPGPLLRVAAQAAPAEERAQAAPAEERAQAAPAQEAAAAAPAEETASAPAEEAAQPAQSAGRAEAPAEEAAPAAEDAPEDAAPPTGPPPEPATGAPAAD